MASSERKLHDLSMDINPRQRPPRRGDRVQVHGFLDIFEVVRVGHNGATADVKHIGVPGPDYIEVEILSQELIYLNTPQTTTPPKGHPPVESPSQTQRPL